MTAQQWNNDDPFADGSGNSPALSFKDAPIGTTYTGTVVSAPRMVQARDYETGNPATWSDGNPKMTVVVNIEVGGEERSLWAPKPSAMFRALADAQKQAKARIEPGGSLSVKFVEEKPNAKNPRLNPQKIYAAKYVPPAADSGPDPFADTTTTSGQPPF
jgi:hypothetical protein